MRFQHTLEGRFRIRLLNIDSFFRNLSSILIILALQISSSFLIHNSQRQMFLNNLTTVRKSIILQTIIIFLLILKSQVIDNSVLLREYSFLFFSFFSLVFSLFEFLVQLLTFFLEVLFLILKISFRLHQLFHLLLLNHHFHILTLPVVGLHLLHDLLLLQQVLLPIAIILLFDLLSDVLDIWLSLTAVSDSFGDKFFHHY